MNPAPCTLMLKPGVAALTVKGYNFRAGEEQRIPASVAGRILVAHSDELILVSGEPVEPPSNAEKARALRVLEGQDKGAALTSISPIPAASLKVLLKKDAADAEVKAAAKAGGPFACALLCRLHGMPERAELCLTAG